MPIYYGKSADGSDMKQFEGVYINPDNENEWSSEPYPKQRKAMRNYDETFNYMSDNRLTLRDVYLQIQNKTCPLSKRLRDYVCSHFDEQGNFKY